jgi:hypothetical protein
MRCFVIGGDVWNVRREFTGCAGDEGNLMRKVDGERHERSWGIWGVEQ